jgi:hypothetical protein
VVVIGILVVVGVVVVVSICVVAVEQSQADWL